MLFVLSKLNKKMPCQWTWVCNILHVSPWRGSVWMSSSVHLQYTDLLYMAARRLDQHILIKKYMLFIKRCYIFPVLLCVTYQIFVFFHRIVLYLWHTYLFHFISGAVNRHWVTSVVKRSYHVELFSNLCSYYSSYSYLTPWHCMWKQCALCDCIVCDVV